MLDNSLLVAPFCPTVVDGDRFIYTEMLNRGQKSGNNSQRLVKTFYHRSEVEFWAQWPTIKQMCDLAGVRACTRLAPRSFKKVGQTHTRLVLDAALTENWAGMKSLYNRALGTTTPIDKLWLFDVDVLNDDTEKFGANLRDMGHLVATIPSKKGLHYITKPFDTRHLEVMFRQYELTASEVSLHKDNPTNLYIPDGAK